MQSKTFYLEYWRDDFVSSLSPMDKLLFIYYIFNPEVTYAGIYKVTDRQVIFDTGCNTSQLKAFKIKTKGRLAFYKDYVYIVNNRRYNPIGGGLQEKGVANTIARLPEDVALWYHELQKPISETPFIPLRNPSDTHNNNNNNNNNDKEIKIKETINNKKTKEEELVEKAKEVIELYNGMFKKNLKSYVSWISNLEFWLYIYDVEDIRKAFYVASKDDWWKDKIDPEMLFRQKNPRGEKVDHIGRLSARYKEPPKPSAPVIVEEEKPMTPEERARKEAMWEKARKDWEARRREIAERRTM